MVLDPWVRTNEGIITLIPSAKSYTAMNNKAPMAQAETGLFNAYYVPTTDQVYLGILLNLAPDVVEQFDGPERKALERAQFTARSNEFASNALKVEEGVIAVVEGYTLLKGGVVVVKNGISSLQTMYKAWKGRKGITVASKSDEFIHLVFSNSDGETINVYNSLDNQGLHLDVSTDIIPESVMLGQETLEESFERLSGTASKGDLLKIVTELKSYAKTQGYQTMTIKGTRQTGKNVGKTQSVTLNLQ